MAPLWWIIFQISCCVELSWGKNRGFLSLCDMVQSSSWQINTGYTLQSWIQSVVPLPSQGEETHAEFLSDVKYISLADLISPHGLRWRAYGTKYHDGWLYGQTDSEGNFQEGKTVYLFPDMKTALIGTFENDTTLVEGVATRVTHFRCNEGVMEIKVKKPEKESTVYSSFTPTDKMLSPTPRERDPQDQRNVYVGPSVKYPELIGEESLFARRSIPPHSHVSYYVGYFIGCDIKPKNSSFDLFLKNLMFYNTTTSMNMPIESATLKNFFAVLGHKVNHDFEDVNIYFFSCKHPVYGEIRCLGSYKHIRRGDELFANYNFLMDESVPLWYTELYNRYQLRRSKDNPT